MEESLTLGKTTLRIPPMGMGTWQWGDRVFWGYGKTYADEDLRAAFDASLAAGVNFFDTAEVYGQGRSEQLLAECLRTSPQPVVVATKFFPFPWRLRRSSLRRALRGSLARLGLEQVDLYQVHWPFPPLPVESWAEALADVVQEGLAKAVGVSNYNASQMRRAFAVLARRGVPLASNQVSYSLLDRAIEKNGLLALCRELGVTVLAYSPLAKGMLTGKYTPENLPSGLRGRRYNAAWLARVQPLIRRMREIGAAHGGKQPAQVALNWLICKGAVPLAGIKNPQQAQDNAGALGWRLTAEEVLTLDQLSDEL